MTIWIPGIPKATQTGSIVRTKDGRCFPKRRGSEWLAYVRLCMMQKKPPAPMDGPLNVEVTFAMPDLASSKRAYPTKRPDCDNLIKGILDQGNGILWDDDAQIVDLDVRKRYARNTDMQAPGVRIVVVEKR